MSCILSKGAKRWISDDITWFPKYVRQMTTHGVKTSIKMIHLYQICSKTFNFCKHFDTVLTKGIRIAKFCTEVFVIPKHLMTKLNTPESSLYMSPLRAIVLSQQYCIITVIWSIIVLFAPLLIMRHCIVRTPHNQF